MPEEKHPILVVDDEPEILYSLRGLLRMEFDVHTAESGEQAMQVMAARPIHVVISDQRMPQMSGVELLRQLGADWPDAIQIVFTGYSDIKAVIDAINEGQLFRYITKPWDPDELRLVLRQACAQFDRITEGRELLGDLRSLREQGLALAAGLRAGRLGSLNTEGQAAVAAWVESASPLGERLLAARLPGERGS